MVCYNEHNSIADTVKYKVPPDSVLGSLLFIIYTNYLPNSIDHAKTILFADDTTVYFANTSIDALFEIMSQELNSLSDWFRANKSSLNISKTNYILLSNTDKQRLNLPEIKLANQVISKAESVKFLGIYIDEVKMGHSHKYS